MRLLDIMTPDPICATRNTKVGDALHTLRTHGIRHLPVVEGGRLVGIATDRDLREYTPPMDKIDDFEFMVGLLDSPISDVAQKEVIAFGPDGQVGDAIDAMTTTKVGAVCVVDDEDRLLGIVTTIDVLTAVRELTAAGLSRRNAPGVVREASRPACRRTNPPREPTVNLPVC